MGDHQLPYEDLIELGGLEWSPCSGLSKFTKRGLPGEFIRRAVQTAPLPEAALMQIDSKLAPLLQPEC